MVVGNLSYCFKPKNVAVIGASREAGKVGNAVLLNLLYGTTRQMMDAKGIEGNVYPINPKADEIEGVKCYPSINDVPEDVDLAVIVIPSRFVPSVMKDLPKKNVKSAIIISAGFSEGGLEGKKLEKQILETAKSNNIRIIGPNCLGVMRTHNNLNASFADIMPPKGPISFVSQSGALCTAVIQYAYEESIGFSNFVSICNKSEVDDADLLEYFAEDKKTKAIALYIESLKDGKKFMKVAKEVIKEKPIVVLKSGRTESGAKAASSHTGSLAGSDVAYEAAFKQTGIYRVYSISELFDTAKALGYQPPARGDNIAIITNAGGPGVMAADQLYYNNLKLAELPEELMTELNEFLPPTWSHNNPIDVLGDATPERYKKTIEIVANSEVVDGLVVILTPQAMTNPMGVAKVTVDINKKVNKPLTAAWIGLSGRPSEDYMDSEGIPELSFPERAVDAMAALVHRGKVLKKLGKLE